MKNENNLTEGSVMKTLVLFSLPYLLSCFMQTLYGMADLFVIGLYNGTSTTAAVSIGSQVTHMVTVVLIGLAMGSTVRIGRSIGAKDPAQAAKTIANTITLFSVLALLVTALLLATTSFLVNIMLTPTEAVREATQYLTICFAGIPFIIAYNVTSSIFRGMGDSKTPMYFVGIACLLNIALDFFFIGTLHLGAAGAALGTILSQAASVLFALVIIRKRSFSFTIHKQDFLPNRMLIKEILKVGLPISFQDGFIQVSFIIITIIANSRGLIYSTSVGIVEKIISFLFLVPSSLLSSISAITAQSIGAQKKDRAKKTLHYGLIICIGFGMLVCIICQFIPDVLVSFFTNDQAVIDAGALYLKAYAFDCIFAGIHFCFSGYFCGISYSYISFLH
ncbi:MAG: hypothetical protein PWP24_735, partial [Clostridiales bacterium]|nr:hypothetical protein [Clostridiales bacterium]